MSDPLIDAITEPVNDAPVDKTIGESKGNLSAIDFPQLKGFFEIDNPTVEQKQDLQAIWDYLGVEADNAADALYKLRMIENRLAQPHLGQTRLSHLADYIKILADIEGLSKVRDSYQR